MNRDEWLAAFSERLGVPAPDAAECEALLELAAIAAHASERQAAPIACWLGARSGRGLDELLAIARQVGPQAE